MYDTYLLEKGETIKGGAEGKNGEDSYYHTYSKSIGFVFEERKNPLPEEKISLTRFFSLEGGIFSSPREFFLSLDTT